MKILCSKIWKRNSKLKKRLWTFMLWSYFVMISSTLFKVSIVSLWYVGMVFFTKLVHILSPITFKNLSPCMICTFFHMYDFFILSISARFLQVLCVCKDKFANSCLNIFEIAFKFLDLLYDFPRYFLNPSMKKSWKNKGLKIVVISQTFWLKCAN